MNEELEEIRDGILQHFYDLIGEAKEKLTVPEKKLLSETVTDAAQLTWKSITSPTEEVEKEMAAINATLENIGIAKLFDLKKLLWRSVQAVFNQAVSTIVKIAISAVIAAV